MRLAARSTLTSKGVAFECLVHKSTSVLRSPARYPDPKPGGYLRIVFARKRDKQRGIRRASGSSRRNIARDSLRTLLLKIRKSKRAARFIAREKTAGDRANLQKEKKGKPWKMNESLPRSLFTFHMRRAALAATIQARLDATEKPAVEPAK
ncbi:hypothetical protein EAG_04888 [Camponotus floridanus]|uniref:Uncharacterized protein n=1 Tax=Camponotus floridanus TaxID=104421 RepID=E2ASZ8_CAMFO|nr:hypothetical protein EAG_04888 [Camponotus floridanus]